MSMYAAARGWIEVDHKQRKPVEEIIDAHRRDLYSGGWAFPERPFNWSLCVFFGGDLREAEVGWLREQVAAIAALPPVDEDGDRPRGLFVIADERRQVEVWKIAEGRVSSADGAQFSYLAE